ncbi:MAG: flagellar basal body L-ring protein FlgH [Armatimonadetes bacterium]|nr:flagellar basal body L-ring protein FlgH [Armatimonadota bacterium]
MMRRRMLIITTIGLMLAASPAGAESTWPATGGSMFTDHRASKAGDLVTIIIDDDFSGENSSGSKEGRTIAIDMAAGTGLLSILSPAGFNTATEFGSSRSATQGSKLKGRLTLKVVEALPNGVLRIEGSRNVLINGHPHRLTVTGLVRSLDIKTDNTVHSDFVADAKIVVEGQTQGSRPGPLRFIIDGLNTLLRLFLF